MKTGLRKPFILFQFWRKILYDVDTIVLTFFIYSVLGWICEVVYCSVPKKHFVNRGFLFGPYLPIYGFGATFVIVLLEPFYDSWPMVMILSAVITSVLEYITSFLLEKIFKVKLWDYSTYPLNLNGRICALNSTLFALLSLFIIYVINTPVYSFLSSLNPTLVQILSLLVTAVMSADAAVAAGAKGIIHAGTGNGSIHDNCDVGLADAVKKGVTVVRSARVGNGVTTKSVQKWTDHGYLEANTLNPQKARILLQLALTKTSDPKKIQEMFNKY